jgi:hypothetical protein
MSDASRSLLARPHDPWNKGRLRSECMVGVLAESPS